MKTKVSPKLPSPPPALLRLGTTDQVAQAVVELGAEPSACFLCGGEPRRMFEKSGKLFYRCGDCAFVWVHALYPEFAEHTEHLEQTYQFGQLRVTTKGQLRRMEALLARLEPFRGGGKLLEIGCGQGQLLELARDKGWDVHGIDMLPEVAQMARKGRGLTVDVGEIFDVGLEAGSFDAVLMTEVIEHVVDPLELMAEIRRVLKPGGVALLGTGNACSWSARLLGKGWHYYRFGGHLHIRFYGPGSAKSLAAATGFSKVHVHTRGFALAESRELKGRWYRPLANLVKGLVSPLAGPCGAGHRLVMLFVA